MNFLHGSLTATYLGRIFQMPTMRIALMGQVFIAFYKGENNLKHIGSCIWQLIWFSFISMAIIIPCGFIAGFFFFKGTSIADTGGLYFYPLLLANFLFPLGAALSAFHIGQGKSKTVALISIVSCLINILLDYFLILGVSDLIPSLGTLGAALAKIGSQTIFCSILFYHFLKKKNKAVYGTNDYSFRPKLLIYYLRVSVPRALATIIIMVTWAATAHVMVVNTEMHRLALSIGGSIILFLLFLYEGMGQALSTTASYSIGSKQYPLIWKTFSSALILLFIISALLGIPLLLFPHVPLAIFDSGLLSTAPIDLLYPVVRFVWLFLFSYGIGYLLLNIILAFRETLFQLKMSLTVVVTSFVPIYLGMNVWNWSPSKIWLVMAIEQFIASGCFLLRFRYKFKTLTIGNKKQPFEVPDLKTI